jgi:hypothetical protein
MIGREAIPSLIDRLDDPEYPEGHIPAAVALGQFGPVAAAAVPRIRALLQNSRGEVRVSLALTLWRINACLKGTHLCPDQNCGNASSCSILRG